MKFFKYFSYLIEIIFKSKFIFSKPEKTQVLLYDQGKKFNEQVKQTLKKKTVSIIYVRLEEINFYVLFKIIIELKFLNGKKLFFNYLLEYCRIVDPDWVITSIYWDQKFYKLKKELKKDTKFCIIQRMPFYENLVSVFKEKQLVDFFFCYDEFSKKIYKSIIDSKYVIIGSFSSNFYSKEKKIEKKDILLISGFRENFLSHNKENIYLKNLNQEKKIINYLIKFSEKENLNFDILLKPNVKTKNYSNHFKISNNKLIFNTGDNAYKIIDNYQFILLTNYSAMGFEAAARGLKYGVIPMLSNPENNKNKNSFNIHLDGDDYINFKKFMKNIFYENEEIFFKKYDETFSSCLFDQENKIFQSYISKF